jgi:hypothetical protein
MSWLQDKREIKSVKLAANGNWYHAGAGHRFERIEHPGEYCMLPWIRIHPATANVIEAPLTQVELIEFAEEPTDA